MKNRKGFTLVELMAVIVVLAIIIAIAVPAYNGIKNKIDQKNYENKIDLIEVAAAKYSEDTKYETMYVDDLIKSGYLDAEDENGYIYDPRDANKIMNCYLVQSEEESGIYYSKVIEEAYGTPGKCEVNIPNSMNTGLKIKMYKIDEMDKSIVEEIKYNQYSKWWVNTDVKLKAEVNIKEGQSVEKYEWYRGYDQTPTSEKDEIIVTSTSVLQQNYTLKVRLNDGKIMNTTVRVYIDKIEPKFYDKDTTKDKTINNKWIKDFKYGIKAYDNESGLYGYKIYNSLDELPNDKNGKKDCSSDFKEYDKKNKNKEIKVNGEYPVCIIDNAGNVHKEVLELTKIDNTDMSCHFEITGTKGYIVDGNQWYIKDDLTLTLKADKVGPSGVSLGMTTNNKEYYERTDIMDINSANIEKKFNSNQKGVKYYGYIKNQADTKNSCNTTIYFEQSITAPTLTKASSTYDTITAEYTSGSTISGIASTKCYVGTTSNPTTEGKLKGNNCEFDVTATSDNTTYYFKKCITSKAGNTVCSRIDNEQNVGYCTANNYTTTKERIANTEGACTKACDTGTRTYKYKDVYTSNYKSYSCGKSEEKLGTENCNTQTCCSKTTPDYGAWGSCNKTCGGGTQTRSVTYKSAYDGSTCSTGAPEVDPSNLSQECNKQGCCSSTKYSYGSWSAWSSCSNGKKSATRTCTKISNYDSSNCGGCGTDAETSKTKSCTLTIVSNHEQVFHNNTSTAHNPEFHDVTSVNLSNYDTLSINWYLTLKTQSLSGIQDSWCQLYYTNSSNGTYSPNNELFKISAHAEGTTYTYGSSHKQRTSIDISGLSGTKYLKLRCANHASGYNTWVHITSLTAT